VVIHWLGWTALCFSLVVIAHGIAMRLPLRAGTVRRFAVLGALGAGVCSVGSVSLGFEWIELLACIVVYLFSCELYVFCFTLVTSSISATTLILLRDGPISEETLSRRHDPKRMVQQRLDRMLASGLLERWGEGYSLSPRGENLHRAFVWLRRIFGHEPWTRV